MYEAWNKVFTFSVLVVAAIVIFFCPGCDKYEAKESKILTEPAEVVGTIYTPPQHGSGWSPGLTENLDLTLTYTNINIEPVYGVIFKCQHGQFVSQGSDDRHKILWGRFQKGVKVEVSYKEIYEEVRDWRTGKLKSRSLVKYDFLDATLVKDGGS